jgi:Glycosyltransferase family 87
VRQVNVTERLRHDLPWIGAFVITGIALRAAAVNGFGWDSHAYWLAARGTMYSTGPNTSDAYLYSPAFAQVIRPLALLPWPVFAAVWSTAAGVALALLLRPLGCMRALPLWLCCSLEIVSGNVFWLFAVVAAFGLRRPALWAIPALTKITPTVGMVWFLVRREWWNLTIAVGATALVGALSYGLEPQAWRDWFAFLMAHVGQSGSQVGGLSLPPLVRVPLAIGLVGWGALKGRRWTIPAGMIVAAPVSGVGGFVVLAALPYLLGLRMKEDLKVPPGQPRPERP